MRDVRKLFAIYRRPGQSGGLTKGEARRQLLELLATMPKARTIQGPLRAIFQIDGELEARSFGPWEEAKGHFIPYDVGYYD